MTKTVSFSPSPFVFEKLQTALEQWELLTVLSVDRASEPGTVSRFPIVFCGVGKSAFLADLFSAQLHTFGYLSLSIDGSRLGHGEMAILDRQASLVFISHSGKSQELIDLANRLRNEPETRPRLLLLTGNDQSPLAKLCDLVMSYGEVEEPTNPLIPSRSIVYAVSTFQLFLQKLIQHYQASELNKIVRDNHPLGEIGHLSAEM